MDNLQKPNWGNAHDILLYEITKNQNSIQGMFTTLFKNIWRKTTKQLRKWKVLLWNRQGGLEERNFCNKLLAEFS